jgi:hypothetical protein
MKLHTDVVTGYSVLNSLRYQIQYSLYIARGNLHRVANSSPYEMKVTGLGDNVL